MTLSAALLMGGKSSRMGTDKACLVIDDEPLWLRQLKKLRALPCDRLFLSVGTGFSPISPSSSTIIVPDAFRDCGPLGGVLSCLQKVELDGAGSRLVVLGVDLPLLPVEFLEDVLFASEPECGAVARQGDIFEPLAAVYPIEMLEIGRRLVRLGHTSMQNFIREGLEHAMMVEMNARDYPAEIFINLNTPDDLARLRGEVRPTGR
ncbi:MAG: molybdenum cofactor guanylyltransferase [Verrucomicrobiales bacterium]